MLLEELLRAILLLMFYSFCGWLIECCYVRICDGHWVNRGLLKGPVVPLYGFGALIVIYALQRVSDNPVSIFISSFIFMSILEYAVGWGLETIFKAKWWDYSQRKWNIRGRVCFQYSVYWGFLGLFLMKVAHPFFNDLIDQLSTRWQILIAAAFSAAFVMDFVTTVFSMLDLREKLLELEAKAREAGQKLEELGQTYQQRVADLEAVLAKGQEEFVASVEAGRAERRAERLEGQQELRQAAQQAKDELRLKLELARMEAEDKKREVQERLEAFVKEKLSPDAQGSKRKNREFRRLLEAFPGLDIGKNYPGAGKIKDEIRALREKWRERR